MTSVPGPLFGAQVDEVGPVLGGLPLIIPAHPACATSIALGGSDTEQGILPTLLLFCQPVETAEMPKVLR